MPYGELCKNHKPEILVCPLCGSKLVYRYTVSNKLIQFTSGKVFRIKNLGYSCPNCNNHHIYVSQTANKLCFKGYTYSTKIVCWVAYYKEKRLGRDAICDIFSMKGIEMSDRNVDILYQKYLSYATLDPQQMIWGAYERMQAEFHQIRLSIDVITVEERVFIVVYDFFSCEVLALQSFQTIKDEKLKVFLATFLNPNLNITVIASVRKDSVFIPMLKSLCPETTKFIPFNKY